MYGEGLYSLKIPDRHTNHKVCPGGVAENCKGISITLNHGYCRSSPLSDIFQFCYNFENNYVGGDSENLCEKGHEGALCEVCDLDGIYGDIYICKKIYFYLY